MTVLRSGSRQTEHLPAYHVLTIVATEGGSGSVVRFGDKAGEQSIGTTPVAANGSLTVGPFSTPTRHEVVCAQGTFTYTVAPADLAPTANTLPAVNVPLGLWVLTGEGAPAAAAQAELSVNPAGDDNALLFTAVEYGEGGNEISIEYVDPGTELSPLAVTVTGKAITVSLETDDTEETPAIVSTAADVLAAIEAHERASELVTVVVDDTDDGSDDDGSGVVTAMPAAFLEGGAGAGVGIAGKGSLYVDYDTPGLYQNTGDAAQPVWAALAFAD
jgi:hypothetical protein